MGKMPRIKSGDFARTQYYQLQKILFVSDEYADLSLTAKVTYSFFIDRARLSDVRGFRNKDNEPYFFFSNESLAKMLGCSERKVTAIKKELVSFGLLDIINTGRAQQMYVRELNYSNIQSDQLEIFEAPDEDQTKWSEESIKKLSKTMSNRNVSREPKVKILSFNKKILHRAKEDESQNLRLVSKKPLYRQSWRYKRERVANFATQSRRFLRPSKTDLVNTRLPIDEYRSLPDHSQKKILSEQVSKNYELSTDDELQSLMREQYLFDLENNKEYHPIIIATLKVLSKSEDLGTLHMSLSKAIEDMIYGVYHYYPDARQFSARISDLLEQLDFYRGYEIAEVTRHALVRAYKHTKHQEIWNKTAYYATSIEKAVVEHLSYNYEMN
ncbi:replication initiator protein A [uncultured Abiotrophia sp.]|uniref:replication initiator protein A n=1 Tax=uncultured Abiotrophia sp. TaxID=316094 RepID=UPI0028D6F350|nr:replication initiator protein A [uncultured Abiotrophia sp.]